MRTVLVEISGESPALARAEVESAAEAMGGRPTSAPSALDPTLVRVELPEERSGRELAVRLGLARRCLEVRSDPGTVETAMAVAARDGGSVAVRRLGQPSSGGEDAGVLAAGRAFRSAGGRIDLGRPDRRFWLVGSGSAGDVLLEEVGATDRPATTGRRMPTLPFQRPVSLPPRLARAAANLARVRPGDRVLDPFLGTGALLAEAGLLGARLYGIDRDPQMVRGALRNLAHLGVTADELVVGDAGRVGFSSEGAPFDAILTDPPYGRASSTGGEAADAVAERVLSRWAGRVRPGGRVVVVTPGPAYSPGSEWRAVLDVPVRVHRSLTREFRVYERGPATTTRVGTSC